MRSRQTRPLWPPHDFGSRLCVASPGCAPRPRPTILVDLPGDRDHPLPVIASPWREWRDHFGFSVDDAAECARMAIVQSRKGFGVA